MLLDDDDEVFANSDDLEEIFTSPQSTDVDGATFQQADEADQVDKSDLVSKDDKFKEDNVEDMLEEVESEADKEGEYNADGDNNDDDNDDDDEDDNDNNNDDNDNSEEFNTYNKEFDIGKEEESDADKQEDAYKEEESDANEDEVQKYTPSVVGESKVPWFCEALRKPETDREKAALQFYYNEEEIEKFVWRSFPKLKKCALDIARVIEAKSGEPFVCGLSRTSKFCGVSGKSHESSWFGVLITPPTIGEVSAVKCCYHPSCRLEIEKNPSILELDISQQEKRKIFTPPKASKTPEQAKQDKEETSQKLLELFPPARFVVLGSRGVRIVDLQFTANPKKRAKTEASWEVCEDGTEVFRTPKKILQKRVGYNINHFIACYCTQLTEIAGTSDPAVHMKLVHQWKALSVVRKYHDEKFKPGKPTPGDTLFLNTWCDWRIIGGWARKETPDEVFSKVAHELPGITEDFDPIKELGPDPLLFHLWCEKHIVGNGNTAVFAYVQKWKAFGIQFPNKKTESVLCYHGEQGVGKGISLYNAYGKLFSPHFLYANHIQNITGRFNGQLKESLLVFLDEADFDKGNKDKLKSIITNDVIPVERKCEELMNVKSNLKLVCATNNFLAAPTDKDDRRYMLIKLSSHFIRLAAEERQRFYEFWAKCVDTCLNQLFYFYQNISIQQFKPQVRPSACAIDYYNIKMARAHPVEQWWQACLEEGKLGDTELDESGDIRVPVADLYGSFGLFCRNRDMSKVVGQPEFNTHLDDVLKGVTIDKRQKTLGARNVPKKNAWAIKATLSELRKKFAASFQTPAHHVFPDAEFEILTDNQDLRIIPPRRSSVHKSNKKSKQPVTTTTGRQPPSSPLVQQVQSAADQLTSTEEQPVSNKRTLGESSRKYKKFKIDPIVQ